MRIPAVNPRTGTNSVAADATPITSANAHVNIGDTGWFYNATTGEFAANGFCEVTGDANYGKWVP